MEIVTNKNYSDQFGWFYPPFHHGSSPIFAGNPPVLSHSLWFQTLLKEGTWIYAARLDTWNIMEYIDTYIYSGISYSMISWIYIYRYMEYHGI